ncbi:CpsB/CapC family capsule biosynthesis tyrosine phosphatase [Butyrivibrio sp. LC3010]|uniref:CpsB/CapC family capsule biosynthesis tyrosine phosphatase n=1 Tax=Butyrivibrio sp. LC3010 TaxID=1280680 RepID=UPI00042786AD|nr:CpsB/CapC family capsule biosynthesis tyrosine phosphatase [Butyrivibrio sp. LC3010]
MFDFHTHILPGIDDGSKNINITKEMIQAEIDQGVNGIVLTPHFYAQQDDPVRFIERRQRAYNKVIEELYNDLTLDKKFSDQTNPKFKLGAEVYFFSGMAKSKNLSDLCIEGTEVLLLEMPFRQWTKDVYREVKEIIERQSLTIILAHIERFRKYQKDISIWNEIMQLPVIPQINTECFQSWMSRRFVFKFINDGHSIILGTDAHNNTDRPVNMSQGREALKKKFGEVILNDIDMLSDKLWRNDES